MDGVGGQAGVGDAADQMGNELVDVAVAVDLKALKGSGLGGILDLWRTKEHAPLCQDVLCAFLHRVIFQTCHGKGRTGMGVCVCVPFPMTCLENDPM